MHVSGYNGADEDEIMDNIYSRFSKEGRTPSGHKTGQKLLMKDEAKLAAGTVLESAHKLKPAEVSGYLVPNSKTHGTISTKTTKDGSDMKRPTLSRDTSTDN